MTDFGVVYARSLAGSLGYIMPARCRLCLLAVLLGFGGATGSTTCTSCVDGYGIIDDALTASAHDSIGDCSACPVGTYRTFNTPGPCAICGAGKYADAAGSLECQQCPAGKVITDPGTDAELHNLLCLCVNCPAGE